MITRRTAFLGAAVAALVATAPALAADDLKLPRQAVELVAPPFVHPHEQATSEGPCCCCTKRTFDYRCSINLYGAPA